MYTLIIKNPDGSVASFGTMACVYDYKTFDELMEHAKELDKSGLIRKHNWELIISQQP